MKKHQCTVGKNDEWLTPAEILKALGPFDLDPCAPAVRPWDTAVRHISLPDDGLVATWEGRVWLNPPFNRYVRGHFMRKMAEHGNGIMLIPAATETKLFRLHVWNEADAVCFVEGRPHFHYVDGRRGEQNCGSAIVLVAYGESNVHTLANASLGQTLRLPRS